MLMDAHGCSWMLMDAHGCRCRRTRTPPSWWLAALPSRVGFAAFRWGWQAGSHILRYSDGLRVVEQLEGVGQPQQWRLLADGTEEEEGEDDPDDADDAEVEVEVEKSEDGEEDEVEEMEEVEGELEELEEGDGGEGDDRASSREPAGGSGSAHASSASIEPAAAPAAAAHDADSASVAGDAPAEAAQHEPGEEDGSPSKQSRNEWLAQTPKVEQMMTLSMLRHQMPMSVESTRCRAAPSQTPVVVECVPSALCRAWRTHIHPLGRIDTAPAATTLAVPFTHRRGGAICPPRRAHAMADSLGSATVAVATLGRSF